MDNKQSGSNVKVPLIQGSKVCFAYNGNHVLKNLDFNIESGAFLGIIGPNGAGKSTLLKLIAGLIPPQSGLLQIGGRSVSSWPAKERAMMTGYVPQSVDLAFSFTVEEVVRMGRYPHLQGIFNIDPEPHKMLETALQWMELKELRNRPFNALSGGEKQRTIIASIIAQQASLMLLDEPTSALDLKHQHRILQTLKQLARQEEKTVVLVTHDINLAAQFCDRLYLLDHGHLKAAGTPEEVLNFNLIQEVYGVKVYIDINPFTESIYILPYDIWNGD